MIPAEAVAAAAKAAYVQHSNEPGFNAAAAWDDMAGTDDWEREQWESTARAALEAAAPHMLAGDASADVAAAFANAESAKRALVARAIGVDPEVARSLGYGTAK